VSFIASNFGWILAALGGLGATVLAVAIFAFGIPALLIVERTITFFKEVVKFFQTPLGQKIGTGLVLIAVFAGGAFYQARVDAVEMERKTAELNAAWRESVDNAAKAFTEARRARDELVDKSLDEFVNQKQIEIANLQQKVDAYEGEDHPACVLTAADLDRVRESEPASAAKPKSTIRRWWDANGNRSQRVPKVPATRGASAAPGRG
jgi:hypothetical protein